MKTKMLVIVALCCIAGAASTTPWGTPPTVDIVRRDSSSVYLVHYVGSKTGTVRVSIKDDAQTTIMERSFRKIKDFTLPLNFSSVPEGVYSIQIDNGVEKLTKAMNYTKSFAPVYSRVESLGNGLYLLTASHSGIEKITVRVYNESSFIIYEKEKAVKGDFSMLFNLKNVSGQPYFEISEKSGSFILLPGRPQEIVVRE